MSHIVPYAMVPCPIRLLASLAHIHTEVEIITPLVHGMGCRGSRLESGSGRRVEVVAIDGARVQRRVVRAEHGCERVVADHWRRRRRKREILLEGTGRGDKGIGVKVDSIESVGHRRMGGLLLLHAAMACMIKRVVMEISIGIEAVGCVVGCHGGDVRREIGRAFSVRVLDRG